MELSASATCGGEGTIREEPHRGTCRTTRDERVSSSVPSVSTER